MSEYYLVVVGPYGQRLLQAHGVESLVAIALASTDKSVELSDPGVIPYVTWTVSVILNTRSNGRCGDQEARYAVPDSLVQSVAFV